MYIINAKKIISALLILLFVFVVGCNDNSSDKKDIETIKSYLIENYDNKIVDNDVSLLENIDGFDCKLEWVFESDYLSKEGKYTAPKEDSDLKVVVKVTYKDTIAEVNLNFKLKGWQGKFNEVISFLDERYNDIFSKPLESDVELEKEYKEAKITWKSSDEKSITSLGKVTRDDIDKEVKLIATVTIGSNSIEKEYQITVKRSDHTFEEVIEWLKGNYNGRVVDKDIDLPKELSQFGASLEWMIGEDEYLDENGKFKAPILDMETDVFITITMNGKSKEIDLVMKLVGWGKEIDVIKEWVKNQVNSPVDFSIRFPNSHPSYISTLVWKSSNEAVLSSDGEVHKSDEKDEKVILTCEITYNGEKAVVEMEVLVPKKTDAEKNFEVRAWLDEKFANIEKVDSDLTLPTTDEKYGAKITWQTNSPGVISESGKYSAPLFDRKVQLVAVSVIGGHILKVTYSFDTFKEPSSDIWEDINRFLSYIALERITNQKYYTFGYQDEYRQNAVQNVGYLPFYVNEGVNAVVDIIDLTHGKNRTGIKKTSTEYIVIHDTGSAHPTATARAHANWLKNMTADEASASWVSWHYTVDEDEAIQHVPLDEVAYHAGDGSTTYPNTWSGGLGGGNRNGIGIETCVNYGSDYNKTMRRTAKLVAELLLEFNLGLDRVKQHYDFSGKDCPQTMRHAQRWQEFMTLIEIEYFGKTTLKDVNFKWTSLSPDIMDNTGKIINHPGNETKVKYKVEVTYKDSTKVFEFESILDELEK